MTDPILPLAATDQNIWLRVGTLLDGDTTTPLRNASVVYNGEGIVFVGPDGTTPPAALLRENQTSPDFDAPDCTLLPGLIEAHAHLFLEGGELRVGYGQERFHVRFIGRLDLFGGYVHLRLLSGGMGYRAFCAMQQNEF